MNDPAPIRPQKARIAIVEDDPEVRAYLTEIIAGAADLDLAGAAGRLDEGRDLSALGPDLFLIDIGLPDGDGLDLVAHLKATGAAKALVVTNFGDRATVLRGFDAGADGYLLKDDSAEAVLAGIRATLDGGAPVSAAAAVFLLAQLRAAHGGEKPADDSALTPREVELLQAFARGDSYKGAARALNISPLTVGNHVKSIYRKLAVNSRGEAVYAALKTGRVKLD